MTSARLKTAASSLYSVLAPAVLILGLGITVVWIALLGYGLTVLMGVSLL